MLGGDAGDDGGDDDCESTAHDRLVTSLHHNHLPRLAEAEIVRWNSDRGTVERGPGFTDIEPFLCRLDEISDELPADREGESDAGG